MFGARYWGKRYFGARYFGPSEAVVQPPATVGSGGVPGWLLQPPQREPFTRLPRERRAVVESGVAIAIAAWADVSVRVAVGSTGRLLISASSETAVRISATSMAHFGPRVVVERVLTDPLDPIAATLEMIDRFDAIDRLDRLDVIARRKREKVDA